MRILILGGTAWLGRAIAVIAVDRGHTVSCLARGSSGVPADATELIVADRAQPDAYAAVQNHEWDAVIEVSWQPSFVREALDALAGHAKHWTLISSTSVYASAELVGADESAEILAPHAQDRAEARDYGNAKAASEQLARATAGEKLLILRPGVIGGPGDTSGRSGAWVARAARAVHDPMLVAEDGDQATQIVDVRDLAAFIVESAERGVRGTMNTVGPIVPLREWVALSRSVGGHTGEVVPVASAWLRAHGVEEFMGEDSLALWLADPLFAGFSARSGQAAELAGLRHRGREELLADVLSWERAQGLGRRRGAGLSESRETELLSQHTSENAILS